MTPYLVGLVSNAPLDPAAMAAVPGAAAIAFGTGRVLAAPPAEVARENDALCVALGNPRFAAAEDEARRAERGSAAAWLSAFRRDGQDALQRVRGRFAVVVVHPGRNRAWLACDRFGTWPLCYSARGTRLAFADRADCVPLGSQRIGAQALFDYLYFHMIPAPTTVFDGVLRVPAGHVVAWHDGDAQCHAWWTPRFVEPRTANLEALKEEFRALVRASVARESTVGPLGAFLSGGTDSSTIVGMLASIQGRPPRTYSIGFEVGGYDEMSYARIAARHFGAEHHEHYVTPADLLEGIPKVAACYDQPFGNSSTVPAWVCARNGRADGVTKMLAGDGGDELFGGNSRYAKQRVFEWYTRLPGALRTTLLEPALRESALRGVPVLGKAASYIAQARVPLPDRMQMYNLLLRLGAADVFTPSFLASIDQDEPLAAQRLTWRSIPARSFINRMLAFDWKYTLADNDLPKVLGAARIAGVDIGFPFLAEEMVDFSLRLPPEWKVKGLTLRWFFKEALRGFLPPEIIQKKKHGFGLPFGVWAVEQQALGGVAADALAAFAERSVLRRDFLRELTTRWLPQHPGYYGEMVWIVMMLERWLQVYAPDWRLET